MFLAGIILALSACSGSQLAVKRAPTENVPTDAMLAAAIENARQTGKTEVNIYLDEDPEVIQAGDLAVLEGRARLNGQTIIWSSDNTEMALASGAGTGNGKNMPAGVLEPVIAGERTTVPGLSREIIGMGIGDEKTVTLAPADAFGESRPELIRRLPCEKTFPRTLELKREVFESRFGKAPVIGEPMVSMPYVDSRVTAIREGLVRIAFSAEDGKIFKENFGAVSITVEEDRIEAALAPVVGAPFTIGRQRGYISAVEDGFFEVDLNHPLAGKSVTLELKIEDLIKASRLQDLTVDWIEDFGEGMERAVGEHKPTVLVLYAGWCDWSRKLLTESFVDPRVAFMSDRFVWVKVDSDREQGLKEMFGQESYPTVLVMDAAGEVIQRLDGYKDPLLLGKTLQKVLLDLEKS